MRRQLNGLYFGSEAGKSKADFPTDPLLFLRGSKTDPHLFLAAHLHPYDGLFPRSRPHALVSGHRFASLSENHTITALPAPPEVRWP
jgi:hypothetical protein